MATNYTSNYQLCLWESEDQVNRLEFNQDNSRIEAGLLDLLGKVEDVKSLISSNVGSLESQISQVSTTISNLEQSITTVEGNLSSLQSSYTTMNSSLTSVSTKADSAYTLANTANTTANSAYSESNPNVVMGYYTGTGSSRYISLGFKPKFGLLMEEDGTMCSLLQDVLTYNLTNFDSKATATFKTTASNLTTAGFYVANYMNYSGRTYIYLLFK